MPMNHRDNQHFACPELAQLIRSLGRASFPSDCLAFLNTLVKIDHLALFGFNRELEPVLIGGVSPAKKNIVKATGKQYIRSFYMSDPNLSYISNHRDDRLSPLMMRQRIEDIDNPQYREHIYERKGLLDRISWIGRVDNSWFCANLYRDKSSGYYSDQELELLRETGDTLCAALERHVQMVSPNLEQAINPLTLEYMEKLVLELRGGLTGREIAVCARALSGMTRKGAGLDLGIQPTTVATLTQRAYAKLNVSSLNELFALCLQAITLRGDNQVE